MGGGVGVVLTTRMILLKMVSDESQLNVSLPVRGKKKKRHKTLTSLHNRSEESNDAVRFTSL